MIRALQQITDEIAQRVAILKKHGCDVSQIETNIRLINMDLFFRAQSDWSEEDRANDNTHQAGHLGGTP